MPAASYFENTVQTDLLWHKSRNTKFCPFEATKTRTRH